MRNDTLYAVFGDSKVFGMKNCGESDMPETRLEKIIFAMILAFITVVTSVLVHYNAITHIEFGLVPITIRTLALTSLNQYIIIVPIAYFCGTVVIFIIKRYGKNKAKHRFYTYLISFFVMLFIMPFIITSTIWADELLHLPVSMIFDLMLREYILAWPFQLILIGPGSAWVFKKIKPMIMKYEGRTEENEEAEE